MSKAYRVEFLCPKGSHTINLQRKMPVASLSEDEAMEMFRDEELSCTRANCGWHGKASSARVIRILPFDWIFAPAS
jgi:hypothetical protein